jgi:aminomethyltransferase
MGARNLRMIDIPQATLKTTALHARHLASGARLVSFEGWDMPVEYSGVTAEHMAVRTRAGLFDVSHMGQIEVAGKQALEAVQRFSTNDAGALSVGRAHLSVLASPEGTILDDILVYRLAKMHFLLVVNAGNIVQDVAWITEQAKGLDAAIVDSSSRYALLALQGPRAVEILQPLTGVPVGEIPYYGFAHGEVANARATISRTGYSGEDGFEMFIPPNMADRVWQALLEAGRDAEVLPCGLAARDTLRLEAGMRLCGQDMDATTTVLEAGLGWVVGWGKTGFIGADHLRAEKTRGVARKLVGFEMVDRGIARHGYPVFHDGREIGRVTSGTQTPFLKKAIGMAYVPSALAAPGTSIGVEIRGRVAVGQIVKMPFYRRAS